MTMTTDETLERLEGANPNRVTPMDALRLFDSDPATFPLSPEDAEAILEAVDQAATLIRSLRDERDSWRRVAERLESTIQTRALEQKATAP